MDVLARTQPALRPPLPNGGEMGELIRKRDWADTPFGPVDSWPQSLKTATSLMLESSFAMVVAWGPDFRFLYNDRYRPILGQKHPRALGAAAKDIFPEVWADLIGPLFLRTRRGEAVALDDLPIPLHRHGYLEDCYFTIAYSPIRDESGEVGGMLAVVAETTERVEGERRLTTLRDLARRAGDAKTAVDACAKSAAILRENPTDVPFAMLYLVEPDGRSARCVADAGVPAERRAEAATISLEIPPDPRSPWPLAAVARDGSACVVPDVIRRIGRLASGPFPEPVASAIVLPLSRPGAALPFGFMVAGISARRTLDERYRDFLELAADHVTTAIVNARAFEEERRRADALAEVDRAKTAFFSNVSHEFRTPLTLMLGPIEAILAGHAQALPEEVRIQLALAHRNSLRLLKLVNALLDFSRLEAGRLQAAYSPVDLPAFTAELAGVFRTAIEQAALRLVVDCPAAQAPAYVDRDLWEKIVFNLLSNALKFTLQGEIEVRLREHPDRFELSVRDTGLGIPAAEIPNVFTRFHRIPNARSRTHEGTGIGLALVLELARLHGGTASVSSTPGAGSVFTVTIPAGKAHLPADRILAGPASATAPSGPNAFVEETLRWLPPPAAARSPAAPAVAPARAGLARIVLADDNADMREYVRRLLEDSYAIEAVADGAAALEAIRRNPPDLVLADVMMPRLDGFQLLHTLRSDARTQGLPVILLSARAGQEASSEGYDAGADDYLTKPFTARELRARIASHLKLARLRDEAQALERRGAETDRQLAMIVQSSQEAMLSLDLEGLVWSWNPGAERLFGYARAEMVGQPILRLIPDARKHEIREILARVRQGEATERFETVRLRKDGTPIDVSLTISPVRSEAGEVIGASSVARNITDRRRVESQQQALYELAARVTRAAALPEIYQAALEGIRRCQNADRASILLYDREGVMRFVASQGLSEAYQRAVEGHSPWSREDPDPRSVCVDDVRAAGLAAPLLAVVEREGIRALAFIPLTYEKRLLGKFMIYFDRVHAFSPEELRPIETIASQVAFAIERRRSEAQLEALVVERTGSLQAAIEQMEEFSYSVSHDLRSPVRAMCAYADAVRTDYGPVLDDRGRELLGRIQRNGLRMDRLIQDLLTYSRIARRQVAVEPVSLQRLVREVIQQYAEAKPAGARIEVLGPLPEVLGHEPSLTQVISNLLGNAVKFVVPGRQPLVQVGWEPTPGGARLWIEDNGIGIKPEHHQRIFGMFERMHPNQQFEGTGIGLAIVRKAMERMNGRVGLESKEGHGSRFWIELPLANATPAPVAAPTAQVAVAN